MKQKQLKIEDKTLFVFKTPINAKLRSETDPVTDPTTTVITFTKTGIFQSAIPN